MTHRFKTLAVLAVMSSMAAPAAFAETYVKDNGLFHLQLNDYGPLVTSLSINGLPVVTHANLGADLQFTTRSQAGDGYNPTQGGDCQGNPSVLTGAIANWSGAMLGTPSANGVLLGIDPRLYNEPAYPGCNGTGAIAPYDFNFGVTLGDQTHVSKQILVLDMSVKKDNTTAPDLRKDLSELPAMFVNNATLRYAYYSDDTYPADGLVWKRLDVTVNGLDTHDSRQWPFLADNFKAGRAIALCDRADADVSLTMGNCVTLYSHEVASLSASHRDTLTLLAVLGDVAPSVISDANWHTHRRLILAGNLGTASACAAWAEQHFPLADWSRW